jgi:hypothetical protein
MEDLNTRIERLSDLDRIPLIQALIRIEADLQARAHRGRRARLFSMERSRAAIIYFLRFRFPVPERDKALLRDAGAKARS